MVSTLPGSWCLFSHMQESLCQINIRRVTLTCGIHEVLNNLCWLAKDVDDQPMRFSGLAPLTPTLDGYPDALGYMCRGVVLLGPELVPRVLPWPSHNPPCQTSHYLMNAFSCECCARPHLLGKTPSRDNKLGLGTRGQPTTPQLRIPMLRLSRTYNPRFHGKHGRPLVEM